MAKRHNHYRGRGGGRGGRGGRGGSRSRGSSRGGGGGRSFKGRGRPKNNQPKSMPLLGNGDLNNPNLEDVYHERPIAAHAVEDYYFGHKTKDKSMKMGGFRPGNREALNTSNLTFRKRPMDFVKAEDVYDPSHALIESLKRENERLINSDAANGQEETEYDGGGKVHKFKQPEELNDDEEEDELEEEENENEDKDENEDADEDEYGDEDEDEDQNADTQQILDICTVKDENLFIIDEQRSEAQDNKSVKIEEKQSFPSALEFDPMVITAMVPSVGRNDVGRLRQDASEQTIVESPQLSGTMETLKISENASPDTKDPQELAFGLAEEDSLVDLSDISIINVRVGFSADSYYTRCFRMFGDHEFRWVDRDNLLDFVLEELNFPEHRIEPYLRFIKNSIMTPEEPEPSYSDIDLSDSDASGDGEFFSGEESVSSDMKEGLDDLITYTEKYSLLRNQEYETSTLNTIGKGKKKKLLVDESLGLDSATVSILQNKLNSRLNNKAKKNRSKEDFIDEQNKFSGDLFKKYPIGLHVQNIKDECEAFLERDKDRLSFPPLDPHGNNVVLKISQCFNLKGYKEGSGRNSHVVAQKTRKTERYLPNYDMVSRLLRQRPIFFRNDVNRPQKTTEKGSKSPKVKFHTQEGQIVGQDAPEIGKDNIGRKMLEKLGWSNGEGLGPLGNRGIAEPVMAKVKKSKSGLKHE